MSEKLSSGLDRDEAERDSLWLEVPKLKEDEFWSLHCHGDTLRKWGRLSTLWGGVITLVETGVLSSAGRGWCCIWGSLEAQTVTYGGMQVIWGERCDLQSCEMGKEKRRQRADHEWTPLANEKCSCWWFGAGWDDPSLIVRRCLLLYQCFCCSERRCMSLWRELRAALSLDTALL